VQADLKALARDKLVLEPTQDDEIFRRLGESYSAFTGEDRRLASAPIEVFVGILLAGFLSNLDPSGAAAAAIVHSVSHGIYERLDAIEGRIEGSHQNRPEVKLITDSAVAALQQILKRRALVPERRQEIAILEPINFIAAHESRPRGSRGRGPALARPPLQGRAIEI
jgi:hypothetical protein